ncbi:MAG: hypothetical protein JST18_09725 [Bacteroidetes bacterium]|nr:hypothetical protein [Bacteroidota bacterium]
MAQQIGIANPDQRGVWFWQKMKSENACKKLDKYIQIRGNIAHRRKHHEKISKHAGSDFLNHVFYLCKKTDNEISSHLEIVTGMRPWQLVS